jgi:glycosyltransferase involved in cell wall biosynthesis
MLLSNPHRPDPRVLLEARALKEEGYEVNLIAWDREQTRPVEIDEGPIHVLRVGPRCPQRDAKRMLTRLPRFWLRALRASRRIKFDVVHAHDLDTLPLGLVISRLSGKPLLYDAHELYAKMVENEVGPASRPIWMLERRLARRPEALITVSEAIAKELSRGRKDPVGIVTTTQDPSTVEREDRQAIRTRHGLSGFVVSYLGALEPGRMVEELVSSFSTDDGVMVAIAGDGTLKPAVVKEASSNPVVKYLGVVDSDEALSITWASDLVLAMMDPSNPNNVIGTPGKVINALALGRPVVTSKGVQIAERIREAGCGLIAAHTKKAMIEAVMMARADPRALAEMGRKGKVLYAREYSWNASKDALLKAYQALVRPS